MMRKTGMLVCTNPNKFVRFIPQIKKEINTTLYIQYLPKNQLPLIGKSDESLAVVRGPKFSPIMQQLYKNSVCLNMDVRVLLGGANGKSSFYKIATKKEVEVVYFDVDLNADMMESFIKNHLDNHSPSCQPMVLLDEAQNQSEPDSDGVDGDVQHNYVALGGTFDRLHTGHKMLLSEAALVTRKRLVVGVTDTEMLKSKILWELIQPYEERVDNLRRFLEEVRPSLDVEIVPLNDMYGPTKDDPRLEVLVVSQETLRGGQKVNEMRLQNRLNPLEIHSILLVNEEFKCWDLEEEKVSSSNGRLRLLGTLLRVPEQKPSLPNYPYVIGLTGGIASGKTSVSQKLERCGAAIIDADKVAHTVYQKSKPGYTAVVNHFGKKILNPDSEEIDRAQLGQIVFSDKKQLEVLNQIVWPLVLEECEILIENAASKGRKVVVVEASLLLEAEWDRRCHEVWACLVPVSEAVKRVQERNKLSMEDATARVNCQITNLERVSKANVVFSTLWPTEFTDMQVDRAWAGLLSRLPSNDCY